MLGFVAMRCPSCSESKAKSQLATNEGIAAAVAMAGSTLFRATCIANKVAIACLNLAPDVVCTRYQAVGSHLSRCGTAQLVLLEIVAASIDLAQGHGLGCALSKC